MLAAAASFTADTAGRAVPLTLAELEGRDAGAKAGGTERRFLCPFPACASHQIAAKHRTLAVNTQTGAWHCHRCHEKGLLREWYTRQAEAQARPFVSARDRGRARLRSLLNVPPPPPLPDASRPDVLKDPDLRKALTELLAGVKPLAGTPGAAYLDGRGLPVDFCTAAGVRFHQNYLGRPAVVFSLRNGAGRVVALHGRFTDGRNDPKSKSRFPMHSAVFATPGAWKGEPWQGRAVITEAPIDALTLAFCGVPALALCGTAGGKELLKFRLSLGQAVAAFDADEAGQKAGGALSALLLPVGCQVFRLLPPAGTKDWNEALLLLGRDTLRDYLAGELSGVPVVANATVEPSTIVAPMPPPVLSTAIADALPPVVAPSDATEGETAADAALRRATVRAVLAAADADALPVVPVSLGPGRTCVNPNDTARALWAHFRLATHNAQPTEARPKPWANWHGIACTTLDDLETLAFWWEGISENSRPGDYAE